METDLRIKYTTDWDDTLPHQVRFIKPNRDSFIYISCTCRTKPDSHNGAISLSRIGRTSNIEESRALYNDPSNHWAEFTEEDVAKW